MSTSATMSPPSAATKSGALSAYLEPFARLERHPEPAWLGSLRTAGLERFAARGLPTLRDEDWRFTNLAPFSQLPFRPAGAPAGPAAMPNPDHLAQLPFATLEGDCLVFVDGHFVPALSRVRPSAGGTQVLSMGEALRQGADWLTPLLPMASPAAEPFVALNDAYFTDGAAIRIGARTAWPGAIRLVFVSTGEEAGRAAHVRNVILAEPHSAVTVIEEYVSLGAAATLTNTVTSLHAGEGTTVEHVRFQDENAQACHFGSLHAVLGREARVSAHSLALGARLSRQNLRTVLDGPGLEVVLNGLYLTDGERLADHHMIVDHAQPHCASHEYFNGILAGQSRGVFHGRILVRPGAQKTDAKQTNKNILLSPQATANTKPQLEIYADDVKCTHGATIGQLNPESVFYLRARGLPLDTARRMLIHAFAGEIIDRVQYAPLREQLDRLVWDRLEREEQVHLAP